MNIKGKVITVLFVLSFVMIISNLAIESLAKKNEPEPNYISIKESEQILYNVAVNYGLKNDWITKGNLFDKTDSVSYYYKLLLPEEVPTTVVIADVNAMMSGYDVQVTSSEYKIDGRTVLDIYSGNQLKLKAELLPQKNLDRDRNSIALLVEGLSYDTEEKLLKVLQSPIPVSIVLNINTDNAQLPEKISKYSKKYVILINDKIAGDEFLLNSEYSKSRLESAVRSVLGAFGSAKLFLIDEHSDLFNSGIYNFVSEQFERRGIKLHKLGEIVNLKNRNEKDIISLFDFYCNNEEFKNGFPASISYEEFILLQSSIIKYKKMGNEFVFASDIIPN